MAKKNKNKQAAQPNAQVEESTPSSDNASAPVEPASVEQPAQEIDAGAFSTDAPEKPTSTPKIDAAKNDSEELESLRAQLQQLQLTVASKDQEISSLKEEAKTTSKAYEADLSAIRDEHDKSKAELASKTATSENDDSIVENLKTQLESALKGKEESEQNYQNLLGRIGHIKATLGERLKSDIVEIAKLKEQIKELESEKNALIESIESQQKSMTESMETLKRELITSSRENDSLSQQLSATRTEYQNSIEQWEKQHDQLTKQNRAASELSEKNQNLVRSLEVSLQEERALRASLGSRISDMEEQIASQTNYAEQYRRERDEAKQTIEKLSNEKQTEFTLHTSTIKSLNDEVEQLKEQLVQSKETYEKQKHRVTELESANSSIPELEREVKEKNLQLGKVRHEAVTLNEHLTKALRMIQKNSQGDTVDKQLVTNMLLSFLSLPRADTKRFEVLQLISNYLGWDDDQNIQAGLRSSGAGAAAGIKSPMTPTSGSRFPNNENASSGGFMSMFADFLERESTRSRPNGR